jgi:hypothetical protein
MMNLRRRGECRKRERARRREEWRFGGGSRKDLLADGKSELPNICRFVPVSRGCVLIKG